MADSHICRCYSTTNNQEREGGRERDRERERDQAKRGKKEKKKKMIKKVIQEAMHGNLPRDSDMSLPAG